MRIIIVEDEDPARQLLRKYLNDLQNIEVIAECADGYTAVKVINAEKPDLILLDIQLPRLNGFEVLELIDHCPQVIFTTAYDEYAIKAFERNATDYLLKPFSKDRLKVALEKAQARFAESNKPSVSGVAMAQDLTAGTPIARIVVKDSKGINIISISDIIYLEAQDDYVMVYTTKGRFMKKQTMKHFEEGLPKSQFVRVHRSFIVCVSEIERLEPYEKDSFVGILKNDTRIKVSSAGYKNLKDRLDF
jgi:two-component system LytT family response regulator